METLLNVLHVACAVFIIGPMAILPMTAMRAVRAGQGAQVATLAKSTNVFSLLSLLVVFFGFGLVGMSQSKDHLSFTTPWILISIIAYVVALLLNVFVVVPAMRKAGEALLSTAGSTGTVGSTGSTGTVGSTGTAGSAGSAEHDPAGSGYKQIAMTSGIVSLLLLLIVVLMVWRP